MLSKAAALRKTMLWVVSGPSGSGKTTLCERLLKSRGLNLERSVSLTTRPPRPGEEDGRDYNFISQEEFLNKIKRKEFIEWQKIFGNFYGTSKKAINKSFKKNKDVLLCIDVKGAMQIKKKFSKRAVFIFVVPPNKKVLIQRIKFRAKDGKKEIAKRIARTKTELKFIKHYDYVVVNDKITEATQRLKSIITKRG